MSLSRILVEYRATIFLLIVTAILVLLFLFSGCCKTDVVTPHGEFHSLSFGKNLDVNNVEVKYADGTVVKISGVSQTPSWWENVLSAVVGFLAGLAA